jgi:hypothetical protein
MSRSYAQIVTAATVCAALGFLGGYFGTEALQSCTTTTTSQLNRDGGTTTTIERECRLFPE